MAIAPWQPGYVIDGRYELVKLVGTGGMGLVWRVYDREWDRDLALKLPRQVVLKSPELRERFVREAETWIGLGVHPHIVQCWFVTEVQGVPSLFLDYLTGGSLKSWMDDGHVRPGQWGLIIEIVMQVAEGLAYAHSKGVIHRDIKPDNLLIRGDERVCVTDFGIVKTGLSEEASPSPGELTQENTLVPGVTGTGAYLGTPMYGAPEQWGAAERVGPAADAYALGVTLYEMCCGRRPFDSNDEEASPRTLVQRHLRSKPPDPREFEPTVPEELARLCLHMLAKDPNERPPQMLALRELLADVHQKINRQTFRAPAPLLSAQSPDVLNNQAVSLCSLGKLTKAVEILRQGLNLDPGHPECLYNLVQLEKRHGRIGHFEALRRLRQARANYPLALLLIEEGLPSDALEALQGISPGDLASSGMIHRAMGDAYMYLADYPAAVGAYTRARELMPKDATAQERGRLAARGNEKEATGVIHFPSSEPRIVACWSDPTLRVLLDDRAEGLIVLTERTAAYLGLGEDVDPIEAERPPGAGPVLRTWIASGRLVVTDRSGFEFRTVPSMGLLARRQGRVLACSPRLDRMVTLDQSGPHLFSVEKGQFQAITMQGQSPDQGPLLAAFDPGGQGLALLLPSGQFAGLDESHRAIPQAWPEYVDGHEQARCMALAGDGALVIGFADGTIRSYNFKTRSVEFSVRLSQALSSLEIHAGGASIVVRTGEGGSGFFLLSRAGEVLLSGDGPVAIDSQGRYALLFFQGRQVMYNLNPPHVLRRWSREMEDIKSVVFSGDGRKALTRSAAGEVLLWEMDEPHRVYQRKLLMSPGRGYAEILSAEEQFQSSLRLAHQAYDRGEYLESKRYLQRARKVPGYGHGAVALDFAWQLLQKLKRDRLEAVWERLSLEGTSPGDLDLTTDGRYLLYSFGAKAFLAEDQDGGARCIWTVVRQSQVRLLRLVQSPAGTLIVIVDESGDAGLHEANTGRLKQTLRLEGGQLSKVLLHGSTLTYLCRGGGIGQLDLVSGAKAFRDDLKINIRAVGPWQPGKLLLATAAHCGILDLKKPGSRLQAPNLGVEFTKMPCFIEHLVERGLLVIGFSSGILRILEVASGQVLAALAHGEGNRVTSFVLLPELEVALTTTARGHLYFWDLRNEQVLDKFVAHRNGASGLRASQCGRYLLTVGHDGMVRYWETSWSTG